MSCTLLCPIVFSFLMLFALPAGAQEPIYGKGDMPSPPPIHLWTLRNRCHEPVRVAVNYQQVEGRIVTQGWWSVPPQGEIRIGMRSEWIGYFAVSASEKLFWWNPEGAKFGIDRARDFEYPGDGQRQGSTITRFHWISVLQEPVTTLSCR